MTFVMHSFMDAEDVKPAWEATQRGEVSTSPRVAETQERLAACMYAMADPETGEIVPACVQHSVLDPDENQTLRRLLPLTPPGADLALRTSGRPQGEVGKQECSHRVPVA